MSERFKYALNGVYRIENFAQHLAENAFPRAPIGTVQRIDDWYIVLLIDVIDDQTFVYPLIHCYDKPQLYIHSFFNILGKDGQSFFRFVDNFELYETNGPRGHDMKILDILNEKNGYLVNGTLSIEYGIHINGVLGVDGIWKFNLNEKSFNPQHTLKIKYRNPENRLRILYCHKQLLRFHSPLFQDEVTKFQTRGHEKLLIEDCCQIAHGVRFPLERSVLKIACLAHHSNLKNVVQYADQQFVHVWIPIITLNRPLYYIEHSIQYGLRHYVAHAVNYFERLEDLKTVLQKLDIEKMPGEAMKTFMAKIFELGT